MIIEDVIITTLSQVIAINGDQQLGSGGYRYKSKCSNMQQETSEIKRATCYIDFCLIFLHLQSQTIDKSAINTSFLLNFFRIFRNAIIER